jgi:hypothetical protein
MGRSDLPCSVTRQLLDGCFFAWFGNGSVIVLRLIGNPCSPHEKPHEIVCHAVTNCLRSIEAAGQLSSAANFAPDANTFSHAKLNCFGEKRNSFAKKTGSGFI